MSKDELNKTEDKKQEKKPLYKQWWFWVIVVFVVIAIGSGGDNDSAKSDNETATTTTTTTNISSDVDEQNEKCSDEEKIEVINLVGMDGNDVARWAQENGVAYKVGGAAEYSNDIESGHAVKQEPEAGSKICSDEEVVVTYSKGPAPTTGQSNALRKAQSYLKSMSFSYTGLIHQLEFEGYSTEDATYAVDNCGADWNEQAKKKAKSYLDSMAFSRDGLIHQLEYEGFTYEQAVYGVEQNGY